MTDNPAFMGNGTFDGESMSANDLQQLEILQYLREELHHTQYQGILGIIGNLDDGSVNLGDPIAVISEAGLDRNGDEQDVSKMHYILVPNYSVKEVKVENGKIVSIQLNGGRETLGIGRPIVIRPRK